MSVADKLNKLLDSCREHADDANRPDGPSQKSKKEQISLCHNVVDLVCSPQLRMETFNRNLAEFNRLLGLSMELLLRTCEHTETDIRLVGDECLNRLIKGLMDSAIGRVIVELFKEMRRNSSPRTLKAALSRFADLCHLVRVQKCRQYVEGLIPVLAQLLQREEETIQDCLSSTMPKLMSVFGRFMNDKDVKNLMTIPLARLNSSSASVRRMASFVLATVCQYSRKPKHFSALLVQRLMSMVFPGPALATDGSLYLGVLMCLRHLLGPNLLGGNYEGSENSTDSGLIHDRGRPKELEVSQSELELAFSLLLYCSQHSDHNVITASLETLQQLLRQPPVLLRKWLVTAGHKMGANEAFVQSDVASQLALACRLCASTRLAIPGQMDASSLGGSSMDLNASIDSNALADSFIEVEMALALENDDTDGPVAKAENLDAPMAQLTGVTPLSIGVQPAESVTPPPADDSTSVHLSAETSSYWPWQQNEQDAFRIPVVFAVNLLSSSFLLSGQAGGLINDRKVRVSVKSLALSCVGAAVHLWPASLQGHVYPLSSSAQQTQEEHSQQLLRDVLLFMNHSDQQLRGNAVLVVGHLLPAALSLGRGDFTSWSLEAAQGYDTDAFKLDDLVDMICVGLRDSSSMASRMACIAVRTILPMLMDSRQALASLQLLQALLQLKSDTYWLVKAELLEIMGSLDYQLLHFLESMRRQQPTSVRLAANSIQQQVLHAVVLPLLGDSDSRVQSCAAQTLVKLVSRLYYVEDYGKQGILTTMACQQAEHLFLTRLSLRQPTFDSSLVVLLSSKTKAEQDIGGSSSQHPPTLLAALEANLSRVLVALNQMILSATSVTLQIGVCGALKELSDSYPVHQHSSAWCNVSCSKAGSSSSALTTSLAPSSAKSASGGASQTSVSNKSQPASSSTTLSTSADTSRGNNTDSTASAKSKQDTLTVKAGSDSAEGQESPGKVRRFFNKSTPSTAQQSNASSGSVPAEKPKTGLFSFVSRSKATSTTSASKENATAVLVSNPSAARKESTSKLPEVSQAAVVQAEQREENKRIVCQPGSLPLLVAMMTSTALAHDVQAHQNALEVCGRMLYGQVCHTLSNTPTHLLNQQLNSGAPSKAGKDDASAVPWPSFKQRALVPIAQRMLKHLVRLLNIQCHVIDGKELPPLFSRETSKAQEQAGTQPEKVESSQGPVGSVSPSKKPSSTSALQAPGGKMTPDSAKPSSKPTGNSPNTKEQSAKEAAAAETNPKSTLGSFYHLTHYRKLFEVCSGAYRNFKSTVDTNAGDKFGGFLQATLNVLSLLLEIASSSDVVKHCEEIIGFLTVTMQLNASSTLVCLQQLFRVVFESNCSYNPPAPAFAPIGLPTYAASLFSSCVELPRKSVVSAAMSTRATVAQLRERLEGSMKAQKELSPEEIEYEKRHLRRRFPSTPKCNMTHIGSCINHFEPLVVRALHVYITTHSTSVQHQILCLLMRLVNLRVNYAMLDADQKFVKSLMRQLSYIEQGHFVRDAGEIIPSMFQFLILLSYERHNVKAIVQVPQIIQLCDGIMASGEMAVSHAIPALEAIVNDLFVLQYAGTDEVYDQEMDTQRDAVLAMLLRLIQRCEGLKLLTLALRHSHSRPIKWQNRSQMVQAMLTSRLSKQQVNIDNMEAVVLLRRTYSAVTPDSIDITSAIRLLVAPVKIEASPVTFHRWLGTVFVLFRVLMTFSSEEQMFSTIQSMSSLPSPFWSLPSSVQAPASVDSSQPAKFLICFLASVMCRAFHHILVAGDHVLTVGSGHVEFVCQLTGQLMLVWQTLLHSGFPKLAQASQAVAEAENDFLPQINAVALQLAHFQPVLLLSWSHVLLYSRFDRWNYWHQLLEPGYRQDGEALSSDNEQEHQSSTAVANLSCSRSHRILQAGAAALFSHFVLKFGNRSTLIFLKRHCSLLVSLQHEPPVLQLIKSVQNSQQMGSVFLNVLSQRAPTWINCVKWQHSLLQVLATAHFGCLATVLELLVCLVLPSEHLLPAFRASIAKLAVQHIEKALDFKDGQLNSLLSSSTVEKLHASCKSLPKHYRVANLVAALDKLKAQLADADDSGKGDSSVSDTQEVGALHSTSAVKSLDDSGKGFYKNLALSVCRSKPAHINPHRAATLLICLEPDDIESILNDPDFNVELLSACVEAGINDTGTVLSSRESIAALEDVLAGVQASPLKSSQQTVVNDRTPLLHAAINTCFRRMEEFLAITDVTCQHLSTGCHLGAALVSFCLQSGALPKRCSKLEPGQHTTAVKFTLLLVQLLVKEIQRARMPSCLDVSRCLKCLLVILLHEDMFDQLNKSTPVADICQLISNAHFLLEALVLPAGMHLVASFSSSNSDDERQASSPDTPSEGDSEQSGISQAREHACDMMLALKDYLQTCMPSAMFSHVQPPYFLRDILHKCVVCLCRLSLVNNYCRTPPLAWKMGWADALALSSGNNPLPPLPADLLRERDLLVDFIWRANVLGWTGRLQFEETWTSLLGMLISSPQLADYPPEEQVESIQMSCLTVIGIASLLVASNLTPRTGHPPAAVHYHQPRQQELPFLGGRAGKRLCEVCQSVDRFLNGSVSSASAQPSGSFTSALGITWTSDSNSSYLQPSRPVIFTRNLDRPLGFTAYGFGQFSVNYLNLQVVSSDIRWDNANSDDAEDTSGSVSPTRRHSAQAISKEAVDVNSCIQLMEDLISQWLTAASSSAHSDARPPLYLQLHAARAATILSDLFSEMQHFTWLLKMYLNLAPVVIGGQDDDLLLQHLVVGICRAAAVCRADGNAAERVSQCVETALRSSLASTQVCGLQGSLYVLESRCGADLKVLLPCMIDFISSHLLGKLSSASHSEQLLLSTWAAAFVIVERYSHELKDNTFVSRLVQAAIKVVLDCSESVTPSVHHCILQGLQRLLLSFSLAKQDSQAVMQLAIKRLNMSHSQCVASALSLLLTCMYTGKDIDRLIGVSLDSVETEEEMMALRDAAFVSLEKVTILFDRMRKSFACDAKMVASVVPLLLEDFVDTTQAMNKMVSEVLTQHQPHPVILAVIMAQAFDTLRRRGLFHEIRDWVILSLGSFIQRSPVETAIWSLSCLFVSAANTQFVYSLFPYLLGRLGCVQADDRKVFLMAAVDFYSNQNLLDEQRSIFKEAFQLHSPKSSVYSELLEELSVLVK
ncbi:huntingtin-like isoform X1 [Sycon ciliatum]|uniref:huntingtin-like isoform X1 n=1 Tax=Sycon ciliatum TaxID=27933 RepID=UPI0031F69ECD